jgi:membrane-bound lytic murein transglycosylase C
MIKNVIFLFALILSAQFAFAEGFDDFKDGMENGFESDKKEFGTYKFEIEKEFEEYRHIVAKEYDSYKKDILGVWNTAEISSPTKWVEYSESMRQKKVVDFADGSYRVEVVGGDYGDAEKELEELLKDMLGETKAQAFDRDRLSKNIDTEAKKKLKHIATGTPSGDSVIGDAVTGKSDPTEKDIDIAAEKLKENSTVTQTALKTGEPVYVLSGKLPSDIYLRKANELKPAVRKYADQYKIQPSLIFSVIQTESAFNPMAQSHIPAYGLMQIVPASAGKDVMQFLTGSSAIMTPSYLFNTDNNIKAGTVYLHILNYRYLKEVNHPVSRLYCVIAAYNTGSGNVAYAFNGSAAGKNKYSVTAAAGKINGMEPDSVYSYLKGNLAYAEARNYIVKVSGLISGYKSFDK